MERFVGGDWAGAALGALIPAGLLLGTAVVVGVVLRITGGDSTGEALGGIRGILALLLLGLGVGGLEVRRQGDGFSLFAPDDYVLNVSGVPYTATALWLLGLWLAGRVLRARLATRPAAAGTVPGRPAGPAPSLEAALRTALLTGLGALMLALFASSGSWDGTTFAVSPFRAFLSALVTTLVVVALVAGRDGLASWRAGRPGADLLLRAGGTAVRATATVLALCSAVALVLLVLVLTEVVPVDGTPPNAEEGAALLALLPNLAVHLLGLSWAVPVHGEGWAFAVRGDLGGGWTYGLSELGEDGTGLALGALALGLLCSLLIGRVVARRSAEPREALLAGGLVLVLFLLLAACGGVTSEVAGLEGLPGEILGGVTGTRTLLEAGLDLGLAALLGILWILGPAAVAARFARPRG
ncbi:hypothetical protein [Streptomyces sp. NPDC047130]|uniref:hypothetical protein n=1 Tax=Streptomyces sp. NPDC047130 TaxID=3155261 RepID=UPI0034034C2F